MIVKKRGKGKYMVVSETTGRNLGVSDTLKGAKDRLRQIEYFKYLRKKQR